MPRNFNERLKKILVRFLDLTDEIKRTWDGNTRYWLKRRDLALQGAISAGVCDRPVDVVRGKIGAYSLAYLPVLDISTKCNDFSSTVGGRDHIGKRALSQSD